MRDGRAGGLGGGLGEWVGLHPHRLLLVVLLVVLVVEGVMFCGVSVIVEVESEVGPRRRRARGGDAVERERVVPSTMPHSSTPRSVGEVWDANVGHVEVKVPPFGTDQSEGIVKVHLSPSSVERRHVRSTTTTTSGNGGGGWGVERKRVVVGE